MNAARLHHHEGHFTLNHEMTPEERAAVEDRARLPRSRRQLRRYLGRLENAEDPTPRQRYMIECLRVVLVEKDLAIALAVPLHPGLVIEGCAWPEADPATRFSVHLSGSRTRVLRRGYPRVTEARAAAVRLAEAADWRVPPSEFSAAHHAAVLAEETCV
ncbi:hypothetical protein [Streptomyces sp. NBC_01264]|uniref:hypothetical protein n=1 Tax=Streptomyces sp. NBC_01264 TaxID=2903804 RepID=UPI00225A7F78|nr:hypothetical protein [Streptomyces sp. NBC_01264]MCX4784129.1 hypothetical protein [Streptomyces sp. NBC_01264]